MHMLAEDIAAGGGHLKIRQSDASMFEVGRNLATTPGKVIFQNDLMQLIQYAPSTEKVLKRPLLIVPPWINKFYVLDLTPEQSFIKWCVDQGLTVFCISWVNPDTRLAQKTFEDYVREGPVAALDAIKEATGEDKVHAVGYCVGGTMLTVALAAMAAWRDERIMSATLFASQIDFTNAGDLKVFIDEEQIKAIEQRMAERGYLDGKAMATVFNMLRSNDLVWPYVINNYLKGKAPFPFDLLYWNSDSTRLPAANHSFYMRNCYLDNKLARGEMMLGNTLIDVRSIKIPIYNLATREDHIAPAKSVMLGSKFFGGKVRFVVTAPAISPAWSTRPTRRNISIGPAQGRAAPTSTAWLAKAKEHPGSWWPDWFAWIKQQDPDRSPARIPGGGKLKPIEDAPGSYVRVKA
jgi:polyhydroxyalkanoate synthase